MNDRLNPQMRAARHRMDEAAASLPPVTLELPLDASRAINDQLNLMWAQGGPAMHRSEDRWIALRGRRVLCRLHIPVDSPAPLPILVWFHGGGWVWSSIDTHDRLVREYAAAAGVAVVSVDYALSPEARFPQALLECADAVRHLARHGRDWGGDPERIVVGGDSAGGNLALATALLLRDTGGPSLRGVLTPYPVTDSDTNTHSYREFAEGYGLTRSAMQAYWRMYAPGDADCHNPLAAPLRAHLADLSPILIQVAELDVLRDDGVRMAEKLTAAGVAATLQIYPGVLHGFMRLSGAVSIADEAIARAGEWLVKVTA